MARRLYLNKKFWKRVNKSYYGKYKGETAVFICKSGGRRVYFIETTSQGEYKNGKDEVQKE